MACPDRRKYEICFWWEKNPYRCARDTRPCSFWRLVWCKGYLPLAILILAVGLYFGIGLARRAMERTENQIVIIGSLKEYHRSKRNAGLIGGCYGWDETAQKYKAWKWDSAPCQN